MRGCDDWSEVALGWTRQERHDVGCHPGRANLGGDSVEDLGVVARDDQNEVVRCCLNDVKISKSFDLPGLGHDFLFGTSEQFWVRRLSEVKVIDYYSRHLLHPNGGRRVRVVATAD
jgi:hypothetical protein